MRRSLSHARVDEMALRILAILCLSATLHAAKSSPRFRSTHERRRFFLQQTLKYRTLAEKKGVPFGLNHQDLFNQLDQPCYYCNQSIRGLSLKPKRLLDGYTRHNTVQICPKCDEIKGDLDVNILRARMAKMLQTLKLRDLTEGKK